MSGEAGFIIHNIDPRVVRAPCCGVRMYKIEGCNHMTCYRCGEEWCWLCRRVLGEEDVDEHFMGANYFGCFALQEIP